MKAIPTLIPTLSVVQSVKLTEITVTLSPREAYFLTHLLGNVPFDSTCRSVCKEENYSDDIPKSLIKPFTFDEAASYHRLILSTLRDVLKAAADTGVE